MNDQIAEFDALTQVIQDIYETKIHFNRVLGLRIESLKPSCIRVRFDMREDLIGNYVKGILHGGVISATLDATGGLIASIDLLKKMAGRPLKEIEERISRVGTIDFRIDFLRPGLGRYFIASGDVMRGGRRVTVTRTELKNDEDILIAVGTGTYLVG
ncbi:MAG: thioesterase family protein [Deltaproteobacteria bacterium]|nr:thioesterase family protein [Deltaproteobacteria bacterium]